MKAAAAPNTILGSNKDMAGVSLCQSVQLVRELPDFKREPLNKTSTSCCLRTPQKNSQNSARAIMPS